MKAKQENIVKERERKLAQKQLEKEQEKQRQLEAKQAEKNRQKQQVNLSLYLWLMCFVADDLMLNHKEYFNEKLVCNIVMLVLRAESCVVM